MSSDCNKISSLEKLIELVNSDKFDWTNSHYLTSEVPKNSLDQLCILGVDEAGRGPVLGPMVYAVCYCSCKKSQLIKTIGCTDSKALTEKKREEIFALINSSNEDIGWAADIISPNCISNKMLKRIKYSLNEIAQNSTIRLIESILKKKINISEIFVDTIGPSEKYQAKSKCNIQKASELKKSMKLSLGSPKFDKYFSGGLPVKGITEIYGESGSGKSQLCMQLAITAQLPEDSGGLNGGAVYICSEEPFQSKRLYQIMEKFSKKIKKKIEFSNHIYILHVADYGSLENSFQQIFQLVQSQNLKLLILDSVTALFRGNSSDGGGRKKAADLRFIAKNLYNLHGKYGMMIVCVNQVSECLGIYKGPIPALGLAWANLVTTRIQLKKNHMTRTLEVIFSPQIPNLKILFEINESGVDAC